MILIKLNNGPLDGFEFEVANLEDVYAIDIEFKDYKYFYRLEGKHFLFDQRDYRFSRRQSRWRKEEEKMVDCPECGEPVFKEYIAKLKCQRCIYKLIESGDIIEC